MVEELTLCIRCRTVPSENRKHLLCNVCYKLMTRHGWQPSEEEFVDHQDYKGLMFPEEVDNLTKLFVNFYYDWDRKALMFVCDQNFFRDNRDGLRNFVFVHRFHPLLEVRDEYGNFITSEHMYNI